MAGHGDRRKPRDKRNRREEKKGWLDIPRPPCEPSPPKRPPPVTTPDPGCSTGPDPFEAWKKIFRKKK